MDRLPKFENSEQQLSPQGFLVAITSDVVITDATVKEILEDTLNNVKVDVASLGAINIG